MKMVIMTKTFCPYNPSRTHSPGKHNDDDDYDDNDYNDDDDDNYQSVGCILSVCVCISNFLMP